MQSPSLFNMSIFDNIRMGKLDATKEEVYAAAKQAEIHEEIIKLKQGYETLVGEGQVHLSLGQRQRIVIAQALIGNPALLVLDEPTASLDPINQDAIQKTLLKQKKLRTMILVTHHLKEVMTMDNIYVIRDGIVVESGSHKQLLKLGGYYVHLWHIQHEGQS